AVDPTKVGTLYASFDGKGIRKSTDGGSTWTFSTKGIRAQFGRTIAVAPSRPSTIYASTLDGEVFRSLDGGLFWSGYGVGTGGWIVCLAVSPVDPDIVYACRNDYNGAHAGHGRVFKSTDGGLSWQMPNPDFWVNQATALFIDRSDPSVMFLGTDAWGVFKSTD